MKLWYTHIMDNNYYLSRQQTFLRRLHELEQQLPPLCSEFFLGVENIISEASRLNYAYDFRIFFDYLSQQIFGVAPTSITLADLATLNQTHLERYMHYLNMYQDKDNRTRRNGARAKSRKLAAIRTLFGYFFDKDKLPANIAAKIKFPTVKQQEIIRLEPDEVAKMLDAIEHGEMLSDKQLSYHALNAERDLAIMSLFLGTGIRISELIGINIEHIDFKTNSFSVIRKGGNSSILYFSDEVSAALLKYRARRSEIKAKDGHERAFFLSLQGSRISSRAVENMVVKYSRLIAPLKRITPHKLRSTYGTTLYKETQDIYVVAEVLGHKDVNTTKKHYAAISEDIKRKAASVVKLRD